MTACYCREVHDDGGENDVRAVADDNCDVAQLEEEGSQHQHRHHDDGHADGDKHIDAIASCDTAVVAMA